MTLTQLTYAQWLEATGLEQQFEECYDCRGDGEHMCFCLEDDGEEPDPECPACAGEGYVACEYCCGEGEIDMTLVEYLEICSNARVKWRRLEDEGGV